MRKNHAIDLKIKAVLKASLPGITAGEVAEEIGIHTFSLYRWKKELRDTGLLNKMPKEKDFGTDLEFEEKLSQLQKENERLRIESAVLKKLKGYGEAKKEAFKIVDGLSGQFSIASLCRYLWVSHAGYYKMTKWDRK